MANETNKNSLSVNDYKDIAEQLRSSEHSMQLMVSDMAIIVSYTNALKKLEEEITGSVENRKKLSDDQLKAARENLNLLQKSAEDTIKSFNAEKQSYKDLKEALDNLVRARSGLDNLSSSTKADIKPTNIKASADLANTDLHNYGDATNDGTRSAISREEKALRYLGDISKAVDAIAKKLGANTLESSDIISYKNFGSPLEAVKGFLGIGNEQAQISMTANEGSVAVENAASGAAEAAGSLAGGPWVAIVTMIVKEIGKSINRVISAMNDIASELISAAELLLEDSNVKKFDARLYGIQESLAGYQANFIDMARDVLALVGTNNSNLFVNSKALINNMTELVNQGITFNVELRALWKTMLDKIVSTFDTLNPTLLRLVLLQLTELTSTYMGIEAAITRNLNSMFRDTLYLNSTYDTVWSNLEGVLANTLPSVGTEIAYQVQLWLGSLSALGLGLEAAGGISSAINALLTGNIDSLGDQGRTLMAMAASRSGISFADLLVNGISSGSDMSKFMQSIVTVLQDIYRESQGNNVLLSEWGDILNLSIADWKSIGNLSATALATLSAQGAFSLKNAIEETEYIENNLVGERTLLGERINNLFENELFSGGFFLTTNAKDYLHYKRIELTKKITSALVGDGLIGGLLETIENLDEFLTTANYFIDPLKDLATKMYGNSALLDAKTFALFLGGISGSNSPLGLIFLQNMPGGNYVDYASIKYGSMSRTSGFSISPFELLIADFTFNNPAGVPTPQQLENSRDYTQYVIDHDLVNKTVWEMTDEEKAVMQELAFRDELMGGNGLAFLGEEAAEVGSVGNSADETVNVVSDINKDTTAIRMNTEETNTILGSIGNWFVTTFSLLIKDEDGSYITRQDIENLQAGVNEATY